MADEKITVGIEADVSAVKDQLTQLKDDIDQGEGLLDYLSAPTVETLKPALDEARAQIAELMNGLNTEQVSASMLSSVKSSLGFITANVSNIKAIATELGSVFGSIPVEMGENFNRTVLDMSRNAQQILNTSAASTRILGARTVGSFAMSLQKDAAFNTAFNAAAKEFNLSGDQQSALLNAIVRQAVPAMYNSDHHRAAVKASGGTIRDHGVVPDIDSFRERLPARYDSIDDHLTPTKQETINENRKMYEGNLSPLEYNKVKKLAAENKTFERALVANGLARRTTGVKQTSSGKMPVAGVLEMPEQPISRMQFAQTLGYMFTDELVPALEGAPGHYHPITSSEARDTRSIANKNSTVPAEVYAAAKELDSIDVNPVVGKLPAHSAVAQAAQQGKTVALTSNLGKIKPNMYQVMSLTYDDFTSGKVIDTQGEVQNLYDNTARGTSVNKIISQSLFTDLIGMHGNLSNGSGGKTNIEKPLMLQMDLSDRLFETDSTGATIFENGAPKQNQETRELISEMFKRTGEMKYMKDGEERTYHYPVRDYGKNGRYVPTNVKDGKIDWIEESAFLQASRPYLEKFGVNIFDNFMGEDSMPDGSSFATLEKFSKTFEARNRLLTPGVQMSHLGGKMPSMDKVAFVSMSDIFSREEIDKLDKGKIDKTETGLDGAMFFMPGYVPGGDATVRAPSVKGVAQSVDYKRMIKDLYGEDVEEFFVPGLNATDEIKALFSRGGFGAIRNAVDEKTGQPKYTQEDIDKNFVDIMKYDALVTDSVIKTPFVKGKTQDELRDWFGATLGLSGGMRIVKTADEFWTRQSQLSNSVGQKLDLTPEELQKNQDLWLSHVKKLEKDPNYAIQTLFSDETEVLSKRIRDNPGLVYSDPMATDRIQSAIDSANLARLNNEIYADGMLAMGLALANPAEQILKFGKLNDYEVKNADLAKTLSLSDLDKGTSQIASASALRYTLKENAPEEFAKLFKESGIRGIREARDENGKLKYTSENIKQYLNQDLDFAGLRYPNNQAEQFALHNAAQYVSLLDKYGLNSSGLYMNANTIGKMGGGDFDGDTVQLLFDDLYEMAKRTYTNRTSALGKNKGADRLKEAPEVWNRNSNSDDVADLLYRQAIASFSMGAVYNANDALTQINWEDPDFLKNYGAAAYDLQAMYDIDSTFAKTGVRAEWTSAAQRARGLGIPFVRLFKGLQGVVENPSEESYSKMGDFSKVNFPSIYNALTVSMLSTLASHPVQSGAIDEMIRAQSALQGIDKDIAPEDVIGQKRKDFLEINNNAMAQLLTRGAIPSEQTVSELESSLKPWRDAIEGVYGKKIWDRKKDKRTDEQNAIIKDFEDQQRRIAHLKQFGIHQNFVEVGNGYAGKGFLKNNPYTESKTEFQEAFDRGQAAQQYKMAIISGASPLSVEATKAAVSGATVSGAEVASAQAKYRGMTFSKSMLDSFMDSPEKWYAKYARDPNTPPPPKDDNVYNLFGSAVHNVFDAWAKDRMSGTTRSADEYAKLLQDALNEDALKKDVYDINGNVVPKLQDRVSKAFDFVRSLPELFKDEEILGFETVVQPDFGKGRKSIGKIDLTTRNKQGEIIHTDLKPYLAYAGAIDQLNLYNARGYRLAADGRLARSQNSHGEEYSHYEADDSAGRPAKYGRVLSYGDAPGSNTKTFEYEETSIAESEKKYQEYANRVEAYANRGFDTQEIRNGTWSMLPGEIGTVNQGNQEGQPAAKSFSYTIKRADGSVETRTVNPDTAPEEDEEETEEEYRKRNEGTRELIDSNTGRGIAKGIALQEEVNGYFDELSNMAATLRSAARKKENPSGANQWEMYRYKLNEGYYAKMKSLVGATDEDRATLAKERDEAEGEFWKAVQISSVKDVENLNKSLRNKIAGEDVDPGTEKAVKEFDELAESIQKATGAYEVFKEQLANEVGGTEELDKQRKAVLEIEKAIADTEDRNTAINEQLRLIDQKRKDESLPEEAQQKLTEEKETLKKEKKENEEKIKGFKKERAEMPLTFEEEEALRKSEEQQEEMKRLAAQRQEQIRERARNAVETDYAALAHTVAGTDYSAEEVAKIKKLNLQESITTKRANINRLRERNIFTEDEAAKYLAQLDSIDVDGYEAKTIAQANFKKEQEEKSYEYKQAKLAREREDEIATARERNEARREGKPVDSRKHAERQYEAKLAELEEQRRVLHDRVWEKSLPQQERDRAFEERKNLDKYISEVKENHDETLRVDAVADIRDLNDKLVKENSTRGADSFAVQYAQQFENLSQQIEEATASYDALQKKINSGDYKKADKDAFDEAGVKLEELKKNTDGKREDLSDQFGKTSDEKLDNLQHLATGKDYTPAEIAQMKKKSLQEQIKSYVAGQRAIGGNAKIDNYTRVLANIRANKAEAIDLDAYEEEMREQLELEQEQKERQEELRKNRILRQAEKRTRDPYGRRRNTWRGQVQEQRDNAKYQLEDDREQLEAAIVKQKAKMSHLQVGTDEYDKAKASLDELEKQLEETGNAAKKLDGPFGTASSAASKLAESAEKIALSFGKKILRAALNEAKQFVVEWNASMTEIQMITGKTNTAINELSANLVNTAVDLRVSASEVGSAAADLYRQGLSDEEVSVRLEDVIKFSKVANITTEQASKILTTAMSNGLVSSTEEAMDAMVALGDSAATTASEIAKGMQKSAGATKEAKVSYSELLTMLTIITSKTQLSGSEAGTTLRTLFNRLYKVSIGEDYTDDNNNRIAATDATRALQSVGINMFDESGNFRGAYDILVDLASGWEGYNDTQRNVILQTIGAGRQSSNLATLLQGLGEDDGELANKYIDLAENSDGVTDEKYQAYYNNLAAAMDNVKSSFDQLIEIFDFDDIAIGFLNFIAECIQGVTALGEATYNILPVVLTLGGAIAGFALTGGNPLGAMVGLFAGFGVSGLIGSFLPEEEKEVDGIGNLKEQTTEVVTRKSETEAFLDRLDELREKENRTTEETEELKAGLVKLESQFGVSTNASGDFADSMDEVASAIDNARKEAAKMTAQELRFSFLSNVDDIYDQATSQIIDPNSNTNYNARKHIITYAEVAEKNGGTMPKTNYGYGTASYLTDYLEWLDEDPDVQNLMQKFGLVAGGYVKASDLVPFLTNEDYAVSTWEDSPSVRTVLSSANDSKYFDENTGTLNTDAAWSDFVAELYGFMYSKLNEFTLFANDNNAAVYKSAIENSVISLLAGNPDVTNDQITIFSDLFAKNMVSEIMTSVGTDAQNSAFITKMLGLANEIVSGDGSYIDVSRYIEENETNWNYVQPDGTVVSGLTKTEAQTRAQVDYGTRYTVGEKTFKSYDDAYAYYINNTQEGAITEKEVSVDKKTLLSGYDGNIYSGPYQDLWDSLKEWKNPFQKESDKELWDRLSSESADSNETEMTTTIYVFDGKEYFRKKDAEKASNTFVNGGIKQTVLGKEDVNETSSGSIIYQSSSDEDASGAVDVNTSKMADLMKSLDVAHLQYESDSNNRVKFSADAAFETIVSEGITSLEALGKAIDEGLITTLADVAENVPEVRNALERAFEVDEEGNWKIREGVGSTEFANIMALIASGSMSYTSYGTMSQSDQMIRQKDYISAALSGEEIGSDGAVSLATTLGPELASKILSASGRALTYEELKERYPQMTEEYYDDLTKTARSNYIKEDLSDAEYQYVKTLEANAQYGISGLLDSQKVGYRRDFADALMNNNQQGVGMLDESMRSIYTNGDATSEMLWAVSAALGEHDLGFSSLNWWSKGYEEACAVLEDLGLTAEGVKKAMSDLNDELGIEGIRTSQKYGASTEDVISNMSQWGDTAKKTASALKTLNSTVVEAQNNQYYRDKYRSGAIDDETIKAIAEQTGFDESDVRDRKQAVKDMLDITEAADLEEINNQIDALNEIAAQDITISAPTITMLDNGTVDLQTVLSQMEAAAAEQLLASYNSLIESGYEVKLETYDKGDGTMGARIVPISNNIKSIQGKKKSGSGGGGGGSGKSAAAKLIEEQDHETTLREHIIKMIQYEETRYQNADELTNYGIMLQHEIDEEERQTKVIEQNIEALKSQMAQTSKGSDDWYSLREAILKAEESLAEMNNTIDENKKKLKENEQAILKLHTDLEQEVKGEIETRISEERDMLDGQVSMEETILEAIRNRYEEEWELMQKDIDKKKKALQEEIDLIDERLQRRKDAEDEAEKYEELAEYKRQLALISTDSTRTKDQAELREKIAELEKELAWDEAEEEADLQKEGLQDQIDAYDEYVEDYQEYLDDLLENANNFADEVNSVMQMSHEEMIAWLQQNVEAYSNSLAATQEQMTQGWTDTFKQMKGIIDTFWEEIAQHLSSKDNFLAYMKQSSSYQNASDDEKAQMEYNWETMYDSWISAKKVSQEAIDYSHSDETLNGAGTSGSDSTSGKYGVSVSANGKSFNSGRIYANKTEALNAGRKWVDRIYASAYAGLDEVKNAQQIASIDASVLAAKNRIYVYKQGGMVDYTGPAWVDGTKSRPEAFLSADDTQMIRTLIDGWKYVAMQPTITNVDGLMKGGSGGNTIGDVYVTLNEAQFNTDEDYELVAQKVGEAFTKELAKNGFTTAAYAF